MGSHGGRAARPRAPPFIDPPGYARHRPEATLLYELIERYYPQLVTAREAAGRPLPKYVQGEFEAYLNCGRLEHVFLRVRCEQSLVGSSAYAAHAPLRDKSDREKKGREEGSQGRAPLVSSCARPRRNPADGAAFRSNGESTMTTQSPIRLPLATLVPLSLAAALSSLAGCAYLETQLQRTAQPDPRIVLEPQDRVSLYAREVVNYRCGGNYFLRCDRAGSITLSCTCAWR